MTTPQNIQIIESMYSAFSTGDVPAVLGAMDPQIEWNEAESNMLEDGNPYIGPAAVLEGVFARLMALHEHFALKDITTYGMDGNRVLATLRYDAKVRANGKTYNAQAAHFWTLNEEGKVISFQQFVDTKKLADALGG